jgi:hypothetical protein
MDTHPNENSVEEFVNHVMEEEIASDGSTPSSQ